MSKGAILLTKEDRALLVRVNSLLEEIIETLELLEDENSMKSVKEAEGDVKTGRVREYKEFIKELRGSD